MYHQHYVHDVHVATSLHVYTVYVLIYRTAKNKEIVRAQLVYSTCENNVRNN